MLITGSISSACRRWRSRSRRPASAAAAADAQPGTARPGQNAAARHAAPRRSFARTRRAPRREGRAERVELTPRVAIETPRLSVRSRSRAHDRRPRAHAIPRDVDPNSPTIVLLSPAGSPHPFYAEFGWASGAGVTRQSARTPDTVWTQQGSGTLGIGKPVTLTWDNGEGLHSAASSRSTTVSLHRRRPGRQQRQRAGDALSVRADLAGRHAGDARLLHPARRPDRRDGRPGSAGVHLQDDRGQEERHRSRRPTPGSASPTSTGRRR